MTHQISYTKEILRDFLGGLSDHDTISCRGKTSHYKANVTLLFATDSRFDNSMQKILKAEGNLSVGDFMAMYKIKGKDYIIELIKPTNDRYDFYADLFEEKDRHALISVDDEGSSEAICLEEIKENNYPLEELAEILESMYNSAVDGKKSNAIRMFGFKYAKNIESLGITPQDIVNASSIDSNTYGAEIQKAINMYHSISINEYGVSFANSIPCSKVNFDFDKITGDAKNLIIYGTPGCGKSYHIEHKILGKNKDTKQYDGDYQKENIIRTTFYQDYSNTDFVGQILPKITKGENDKDNKVEYVFNPGPFTLALVKAIELSIKNSSKRVALVIEEINRGNAPSIFGDIFQLLDREDGISEYGIKNVGIMDYLNDFNFGKEDAPIYYNFSEIKLPGNLDIYATMNTSDQNVFTLDTAFIRRWDRLRMENSFEDCKFANKKIPGMEDYTWEEFVNSINEHIGKNLDELQVNEDKQIGAYFVKESVLLEDGQNTTDEQKKNFAYKVLEYLWNDVAKLDHSIFFNSFDTLGKLIDAYVKNGAGVFKPGILKKANNTEKATLDESEDNDEE